MTRVSALCTGWLLILLTGVADYVSASQECRSGYVDHGIQSPNYPGNYPDGLDCYWHIQAPEKHFVRITLHDLNVEGEYPNCPYDKVRVRQTSPTGLVLRTYCGQGVSTSRYQLDPVTVESEDAYVTLTTDEATTGSGFFLTYEFIPAEVVITNISASPNSTCHLGVIPGGLQSPLYPNLNPTKVNCSWTIHGPPNQPIIVEFETFRFPNTGCRQGWVEISDSNYSTISYCGGRRPSFRSRTDTVTVTFISDSLSQGHGFRLNYRSLGLGFRYSELFPECGRIFDADNGFVTNVVGSSTESWNTVQAPEYHAIQFEFDLLNATNEFYQLCANSSSCVQNTTHCSWSIGTPDGEFTQLNFNDLTNYFHEVCPSDSLEVWDGYSSKTPLVSYCGGPVPTQLRSFTNSLRVYKLGVKERINYILSYKFVCEPILLAGQGFFVHRGSDKHYFATDSDRTCRYTIRAAEDEIVRLKINSNTLSSQSVELYDGTHLTKNLTGVTFYEGFTSTNTAVIAITTRLGDGGTFNMSYWSEQRMIRSGDRVMISHTDACYYLFDSQLFPVIQKVFLGKDKTKKLATHGEVIEPGDVVRFEPDDVESFGGTAEEWNISGDIKYTGQVMLESSSRPGRFLKALQSWVSLQNQTYTVTSTCDTAAKVRVCHARRTQNSVP